MANAASLNWELIHRAAARMSAQRFERGATMVGLLGPLVICGWTIARPFDLRQSYHSLLQCVIWLAAWYVLFAVFYAVLVWLRSRLHREGEDLAHLPLPATHFLMLRAMELALIPLRCALLTLPLWLIVLAYIRIPYGQQWVATEWSWWNEEVPLLWLGRIGWTTVTLITATLLPLGVALAIAETVRNAALRIAFLLGPAVGVYFVLRIFSENFRMPYRSTIPYPLIPFALVPVAVLLLAACAGLMRRGTRLFAASLIVVVIAAGFLMPRLDVAPAKFAQAHAAPYMRAVYNSSLWLAGHLSPPRNVRLLMESFDSNVLLKLRKAPRVPQYPQEQYDVQGNRIDDPEWEAKYEQYQRDSEAYDKAYASMPRVPMWVGAGLMPIMLPLLIFGGLMLGAHIRGVERADATY